MLLVFILVVKLKQRRNTRIDQNCTVGVLTEITDRLLLGLSSERCCIELWNTDDTALVSLDILCGHSQFCLQICTLKDITVKRTVDPGGGDVTSGRGSGKALSLESNRVGVR